MRLKARSALLLAVAALWTALPAAAENRDRSEVFHNITVPAGDTAADVACVGCNVRVEGTVTGDVATVFGNVVVHGVVRGDVAAVLGSVRVESAGSVGGDVAVIAGRLVSETGSTIHGDVARIAPVWVFLPFIIGLGILVAIVILIIEIFRRRRRPASVTTVPGPAGR